MGEDASKTFHVCKKRLYVYTFYVYMHTYRIQNFEFYTCAYRQKTYRRIELVVTFYVYAHTHKEIKKNAFFDEKRDPSERRANSDLRNLTHITQKPSYVYTFFTSTLKEITALR